MRSRNLEKSYTWSCLKSAYRFFIGEALFIKESLHENDWMITMKTADRALSDELLGAAESLAYRTL